MKFALLTLALLTGMTMVPTASATPFPYCTPIYTDQGPVCIDPEDIGELLENAPCIKENGCPIDDAPCTNGNACPTDDVPCTNGNDCPEVCDEPALVDCLPFSEFIRNLIQEIKETPENVRDCVDQIRQEGRCYYGYD